MVISPNRGTPHIVVLIVWTPKRVPLILGTPIYLQPASSQSSWPPLRWPKLDARHHARAVPGWDGCIAASWIDIFGALLVRSAACSLAAALLFIPYIVYIYIYIYIYMFGALGNSPKGEAKAMCSVASSSASISQKAAKG